jgi:hypothetical protein
MDSIPIDTPANPQPPPIDEPPGGRQREPVIDEPGRVIPAVDPRRPGEPRKIRDPRPDPEEPSGPATARPTHPSPLTA